MVSTKQFSVIFGHLPRPHRLPWPIKNAADLDPQPIALDLVEMLYSNVLLVKKITNLNLPVFWRRARLRLRFFQALIF
jgi:hypothetical protein